MALLSAKNAAPKTGYAKALLELSRVSGLGELKDCLGVERSEPSVNISFAFQADEMGCVRLNCYLYDKMFK